MNLKARLRQRYKLAVETMAADERAAASAKIASSLVSEIEHFCAGYVGMFAASERLGEPDIQEVFEQCRSSGIVCGFPRVEGKNLVFLRVDWWHQLVPGTYGVLEPPADLPLMAPAQMDILLVPGAAFTPRGARLGRGGGFYDRYLGRERGPFLTYGVAYHTCLADMLPMDAHDIYVSKVITEER